MKIVGLTGGIGSGKSTVAGMFEHLGIPVYYADLEAKTLMNTSESIKSGIIKLFGKEAFKGNMLDRAYIAGIVFRDQKKLKALNGLVHPVVRKHFLEWVERQSAPYVIQENPLLFEKNNQNDFDVVITVTAGKKKRIKRVMERDGMSESEVLDRMQHQLDDALKISGADFVIQNDIVEDTRKKVREIHQELI